MTDVRIVTEGRSAPPAKDLELVVHALREAMTVIDDFDPDRNPARCIRQIRRLLDNPNLRVAIVRVGADIPIDTD